MSASPRTKAFPPAAGQDHAAHGIVVARRPRTRSAGSRTVRRIQGVEHLRAIDGDIGRMASFLLVRPTFFEALPLPADELIWSDSLYRMRLNPVTGPLPMIRFCIW